MPANSHEQVSGGRFEEIPAPAGARPGSQWFACEPSESWGTWIGDGTAEFFLDSLEEDGQRIKACRTRINRDTKEYTRGCFTKLLLDTPMGYVYRVHVRYKCPGATQPKPIDLRPIFRTSGGITYAGRALPASEDWSSYTSPWVAPPGAGATLDVEVLYKHLNDGRQHLDCWFRTFLVERVPVKLRRPADGEIVRGRSPVFSWDVARADVLQVSTSEDFPPGDATWRVGKNKMPVAAYRFENRTFPAGIYYWRIGFGGDEKDTFWIGPGRFTIREPLPGHWMFDFGSMDSPVDPDAMAVNPSSEFSDAAGYGFEGAHVLRGYSEPDRLYRKFEFEDDESTWRGEGGKYNRNRELTLNTPITRDFIEGEGPCAFRVNLPDGAYRALIVSGHPNEQTLGDRRVYDFEARSGGEKVRFRKTWPFALHEIHPLRVEAENGALEIELAPSAGDDRWVVNGILLMTEQKARSEEGKDLQRQWYESVYTAPRSILDGVQPDWPEEYARKQPSPPPPNRADRSRGFILFSRTTKHPLHPLDVPKEEERILDLKEIGSRGEPVQLTFSLWPVRELYGVTVVTSDLSGTDGSRIPKSACRVRSLYARTNAAYYESIRDWDGILMDAERLDLEQHRTQQYLLTVNIPADAAAGTYRGMVTIQDEAGDLAEIPVELEVTPFVLEPADMLFVLFVSDRWEERSSDSAAVRALLRMGKQAAWSGLAAHGSTTIEFGGSIASIQRDGEWVLDCDRVRGRIRDWRESGGIADFAYVDLGWGVAASLLKAWAPEERHKHHGKRIKEVIAFTQEYRERFPDWIRSLDQCIRDQGIQTIVYALHDEPHAGGQDAEIRYVRDLGTMIRQAVPESYVYVNTMNGPYMKYLASSPELGGEPIVKVWWTYGGITEEQKEELAARGVRFLGSIGITGFERENQGFMAWRERRYGGIDWTYNNFYASAASLSDGPTWSGDASQMVPTTPLIDRYRWELIQQGYYDMRYIRTLEKAIAKAMASAESPRRKRVAREAQGLLNGFWQSMIPGSRDMSGVDPILARRQIIRAIMELDDAR